MSCLREVQTISKSPDILPLPSLTRLTTGGVLNPLKNTTNTSHNELLHQDPLQPPLEPRARDLRGCGRQSADPLGDKSPKATVLAEWDCTLVDVVSVVVYWSHANPLYRTRTRYLECGRGCPCSH